MILSVQKVKDCCTAEIDMLVCQRDDCLSSDIGIDFEGLNHELCILEAIENFIQKHLDVYYGAKHD